MFNILFTGVYQVFDDYIFSYFSKAFNASTIICTGSNVEDFQIKSHVHVITNAPLNKNRNEYILFLNELIQKYNIDLIVPMVDSEVLFLSKHREQFKCEVFSADFKIVVDCLDKVKCHEILGDISPQYYKISDPETLKNILNKHPDKKFVIRPYGNITGSGKGMRILSKYGVSSINKILSSSGTREMSFNEYVENYEAIFYSKECPDLNLILTDYLPGQEYSCYLTSSNGKLIDLCINKKLELESGTTNTARAEVIFNSKIEEVISGISEKLNLHYISNIQLKEDEKGNFKLVEVNPRIAGSIMLPIKAGYGFFKQSYDILNDKDVTKEMEVKKTLRMIRVYNEFFR